VREIQRKTKRRGTRQKRRNTEAETRDKGHGYNLEIPAASRSWKRIQPWGLRWTSALPTPGF
jgi:hypothetical protein